MVCMWFVCGSFDIFPYLKRFPVKMAKECKGLLMTKSVGLCTQHLLPFLSMKAFIFLCIIKK